jgi:methylthioribose-1-phosphate isomerase
VIPDDAAAGLMRRGEVDAVIVGADRVCRNGDVVNKVGTYGLALAAREHEVPFVVAAPVSTLDPGTARGDDVAIEERADDVAAYLAPAALPGRLETRAPAFDVTPAGLVAALVTDLGTLERPTPARLSAWMRRAAALQAGEAAGR